MKILVTGGAGFIGHYLIKELKKLNHDILSIDNYSNGYIENHIDGVQYLKGDTNIIDAILHIHNIKDFDVIFHLGEQSRILPSFDNIKDTWQSNIMGTFNIIEYCKKNNVKLIYAGSSTKFAEEGIGHSPYAFAKAQNISLIKYYADWYDLKYNICYFYNVFGKHNNKVINQYDSVISNFINKYKNNLPIIIYGTGLQTRTFTYVGDIVDGLIKSMHYPNNEEFQLANPKEYSILELAKLFNIDIQFMNSRKGDRKKSILTNDNAHLLLNWKSTINVDNWIIDYLKLN